MSKQCYFVLGCPRSGTTSIAQILNRATNGECHVEPYPNLNREARDRMDGKDIDGLGLVKSSIVPRIEACERQIYGEKNAPLGMFIRELHELTGCRFLFVVRDGRDVVRSLINWHNGLFGNIYRECKDPGDLSDLAKEAIVRLPVEKDESDYFRPRPRPGEPLYANWGNLSRLEMCAYCWSRYNKWVLGALSELPSTYWRIVDYTNPTAEKLIEAAEFLGLAGLSHDEIKSDLENRINSLQDRTGRDGRFPRWSGWSADDRKKFAGIATPMMERFGYRLS